MDFVSFVNKYVNIVNYLVSSKFQQFNYNNNFKNKRLLLNEKMDIFKYIMNINDGGKLLFKLLLKRDKVKVNSCCYCG